MAKRETMKWDAQVHEDILMCMFQRLKLSNQDWTSVMEELHGMGYSFTEGALRQHVQKLRKARDTSGIQSAGTTSATAAPRKKANPRKRAAAGKKSKAAADDDDVEDEKFQLKLEHDDEDIASPSRVKRAKTTPKPEPEEDEGFPGEA